MKTKKAKRKTRRGGLLKTKCTVDPQHYPKCGKEGCVYLHGDRHVTKRQWKTGPQMRSHMLSIEGQTKSKPFAPDIVSHSVRPCDLISEVGREAAAPCFVKRYRTTRNGKKVLYEEEKRDSWCRNYGIKNQCIVDDKMYQAFKKGIPKVSYEGTPSFELPDIDTMSDGDGPDSIEDEGLGNLHDKVDIPQAFTDLNPVLLTELTMNRVQGITIQELIQEMVETIGEKTMSVAAEWETEKEKLIQKVRELGYYSDDFNEQNIMIDVDEETLCTWIDEQLAQGIPITPAMIKKHFKKEDILKIVDWGQLKTV